MTTSYDALDRKLVQIQSLISGQIVVTQIDTYDAAGRKSVTTKNSVIANYSYDAASRLTGQVKPNQGATFVYDAVGNTLVKAQDPNPPLTMTYDAASRLVSSIFAQATTNFTFDNNGNQTTENVSGVITGYVYDNENRLTKITYPDLSLSSYTYDGDGLRRTRQEPGGTVHTQIWDKTDYLGEL